MALRVVKYHGLGNDYLVLDPADNMLPLTPERIRLICHRNYGIGSDGILYGPVYENDLPCVRIFNPDGSEAEKSGNGIRIFARYLRDKGYITAKEFVLRTRGGDVRVEYLDSGVIKVMMGRADFVSTAIPVSGPEREVVNEAMAFAGQEYRVTCLTIGNPHCVIPMQSIRREQACALGAMVETAPYFPNRINMQLLQVVDRKTIAIEIYERGAGYTLASGSSSCVAACAAQKLGLVDASVTVRMPGGMMHVDMPDSGDVYLTGPVALVGTAEAGDEFLDAALALGGEILA